MITELRYAHHPDDFSHYGTQQIRSEFLIETLFKTDDICLVYTLYDRFIVGGAMPVNQALKLETFNELKSEYFLDRRELGIINTGGEATVDADGVRYHLQNREALYLGKGIRDVIFTSENKNAPAKLYLNSAPAHHAFPSRKVTLEEAEVVEAGNPDDSNRRTINKLLINSIVETCGLQMGMTILHPGSVWNTMPPHTHNRRMEAYFYFDVPEKQAVCHFMGKPDETRHIWMKTDQAVISPSWSIHSAAGTANYSFIWGMTGENLDYGDMDMRQPDQLR